MKINKYNALRFWEECYGSKQYAEDFHGNLMCKDGYGNNNFSVNYYGQEIYCGWNIHHILPLACGGTNAKSNLLCTNIATNEEAGDRITFWIGESLYQVKRIYRPKIGSFTTSALMRSREPYRPSSLSPEKSCQPLFMTRVPPSLTFIAP